MDFLGVGPGELLFILILALILFGPRRLPEIGRALGKSVREFRQVSEEFTTQLRQELEVDPAVASTKPRSVDGQDSGLQPGEGPREG